MCNCVSKVHTSFKKKKHQTLKNIILLLHKKPQRVVMQRCIKTLQRTNKTYIVCCDFLFVGISAPNIYRSSAIKNDELICRSCECRHQCATVAATTNDAVWHIHARIFSAKTNDKSLWCTQMERRKYVQIESTVSVCV